MSSRLSSSSFFFFNDTATTEIYTLSLHDALPISFPLGPSSPISGRLTLFLLRESEARFSRDRKSTRLNSSHGYISYAVFCLKKKKYTLTVGRRQEYDPRQYVAIRS